MDVDRLMTRLNPVVTWLLRSPMHGLLSRALMLLQVTGRRTGRRYWIPVGYQRAGDTITVLVSRAPRKLWWRNFRDPAPVVMLLRGQLLHGRAVMVKPDSPAFRTTIERTLQRVPSLGGQFGIQYDPRVGLTTSQWPVVTANGVVVSIEVVGTAHDVASR